MYTGYTSIAAILYREALICKQNSAMGPHPNIIKVGYFPAVLLFDMSVLDNP